MAALAAMLGQQQIQHHAAAAAAALAAVTPKAEMPPPIKPEKQGDKGEDVSHRSGTNMASLGLHKSYHK